MAEPPATARERFAAVPSPTRSRPISAESAASKSAIPTTPSPLLWASLAEPRREAASATPPERTIAHCGGLPPAPGARRYPAWPRYPVSAPGRRRKSQWPSPAAAAAAWLPPMGVSYPVSGDYTAWYDNAPLRQLRGLCPVVPPCSPPPSLAFSPIRCTIVLGVSNLSSGRKPTFLLL